jgi:hypothetical protein
VHIEPWGERAVKKLLATTIVSFLVLLGGGSTAFAGPNDGYTGVVQPEASAQVPDKAKAGKTIKVRASVDLASNGAPCRGRFMLKVTPVKNPYSDPLLKMFEHTNGGDKVFEFKINEPGRYIVKVRFIPEHRSPCKGAHTEERITIT